MAKGTENNPIDLKAAVYSMKSGGFSWDIKIESMNPLVPSGTLYSKDIYATQERAENELRLAVKTLLERIQDICGRFNIEESEGMDIAEFQFNH